MYMKEEVRLQGIVMKSAKSGLQREDLIKVTERVA